VAPPAAAYHRVEPRHCPESRSIAPRARCSNDEFPWRRGLANVVLRRERSEPRKMNNPLPQPGRHRRGRRVIGPCLARTRRRRHLLQQTAKLFCARATVWNNSRPCARLMRQACWPFVPIAARLVSTAARLVPTAARLVPTAARFAPTLSGLDHATHAQVQPRNILRSATVIRIVVLCWKALARGCSAAELFDFFQ
jgi:hypothetical protein